MKSNVKPTNNRYNDGDNEAFKAGYRAIFRVSWKEKRKNRTCQYTESGKCDSVDCIHIGDKCYPRHSVKPVSIKQSAGKHFFRQFIPYFHVGLGEWVRSKRQYQQRLKEKGLFEAGDAKFGEDGILK